jgi:hypothetical protein
MLASLHATSLAFRLPFSGGSGEARATGTGDTRSPKQTITDDPSQKLSEDQIRQLESLKSRDREVRAHEAAHQAAAGGLVRGGASFSYQRGPDGQIYAIGGEVSIDTSPVPGNPEATLAKAQTIARAALAPAEPSSQDRQVAAQAAQMTYEARIQLTLQQSARRKSDRFKTVETSDREAPTSVDAFA